MTRDTRKKSRKSRRKRSVILRLVLLAFLVYGIVTLGQIQFQLMESTRRLNAVVAAKEEVQLHNAEITAILENGTEAEFVERAARERLGYVFPNEEVFVDTSGK